MSRSTTVTLRQLGHAADDVRDVGLRGRSDQEIFAYAQQQGATLVTADKGFGNILQFPLGTHAGIILLRLPDEWPSSAVNRQLANALSTLQAEDLVGLLMIVEVGRIRLRRPGNPRSAG